MLSITSLPLRPELPAASPQTLSAASSRASRSLQIGVVALVLSLSCLAALAALPRASSTGTEPFALVFPPWTSARAATELSFAAGFSVLRGGAWSFVTIVAAPDAGSATQLPATALALKLAGLAGCLDPAGGRETTP